MIGPEGIVSLQNIALTGTTEDPSELEVAQAVINWLSDIYINPKSWRLMQ